MRRWEFGSICRISTTASGAGHSTFRYLRDFPADSIEIDRSFVSRIDVSVVGEGMETAAQHDFLRGLGCTRGQGYLLSMPLKAEDFAWMLKREMTLPAKRRTA